jgi:glyoxylase-like metal-dependent hydrolase (beta-lactamase superfamily II)
MVTTIDLRFQDRDNAIAAFVLKTKVGPVLIETGPHSCLPALEEGLRKIGYRLSDVQHVLLTHIHLDHAGAAWTFAQQGATIYVHPLGLPHLQNPEKLLSSAKRIYQDKMDSLWGDLRPIPIEQLRGLRAGERFAIGGMTFNALHTPGHAIHHIVYSMGDLAFTGDVAGVKIGESGPVVPPCPPPDINLQDWEKSIALLRKKMFTSLFLTHFGEVKKPKPHLLELEGRLHNWANWIKPYWEQGIPMEEVLPMFKTYVERSYDLLNMSDEDRLRYELANPPDMSVGGLYRYWSKKTSKAT